METEKPIDYLYKVCKTESYLHQRSKQILDTFKANNADSPQLILNGLLSLIELNHNQGKQDNIDAYFFLLSQAIQIFPSKLISLIAIKVSDLCQKWSKAKDLKTNLICFSEIFVKLEGKTLTEFGKTILNALLSSSIEDNAEKRKIAGKCLNQILEKRNDLNQEVSHVIRDFFNMNWGTTEDILYSLVKLFDTIVKSLSLEYVGDFVYTCLKGLKINDSLLSCHIYLIIEHALSERSVSSDVSETVSKEMLYEPVGINAESNQLQAYYQCLLQSLIRLNIVYPQGARVLLPTFLSLAVELIDSDKKEVSNFCTKAIQSAITSIITPSFWISNVEEDFLELGVSDMPKLWDRTIAVMSYLLSKRFENHKSLCYGILATFFECTTKKSINIIESLVRKLIDSCSEAPQSEYNLCLKHLLNSFGPTNMNELYPFKFNESMDILATNFDMETNFWLLHLMTVHLKSASLKFFLSSIYPQLIKVEDCLKKENNEKKIFMLHALEKKFWMLLSKCWKIENEKQFLQLEDILNLSIAKVEAGDDVVIRSLISLVSAAFDSQEIKAKLSVFSTKLIPKLAKCLELFPHQTRDIILCMEAYSMVASPEYLDRVWTANVDKQLEGNLVNKDVNIIVALTTGIDIRGNKWSKILTLIQKLLSSTEYFEKKGYKLINVLIPKVHESFLGSFLTILKSSNALSLSARGARINTLQQLWQRGIAMLTFDSFADKGIAFIKEFLPEIVLSLKESSQKARRNGKTFLLEIANKVSECGMLTPFIIMILSGLAGSSSLLKSDSLFALTVIAKSIPKEMIGEINDLCIILLKENIREIFLNIIKLYKTLCTFFDLRIYLKDFINEVYSCQVKEDCKLHIRYLMEKLAKKYSEDFIKSILPNENWKLLRHIRKQKNRTIKKRKHAIEADHENDPPQIGNVMPITSTSLKLDLENDRFHFVEQFNSHKHGNNKNQETEEPHVKVVDGKLIIKERPTENIGLKRKREDLVPVPNPKDSTQYNKKDKAKSKFQVHTIKGSGEEYRHSRSKGDLKLPGKPDPYAFIQLSHKALNKRHKSQASKAFDEVMKPKSAGLKGMTLKKVKK